MATVQLRHGDVFDGPSDLIALPCSTAGTVTGFVMERLVTYKMPRPAAGVPLGDVKFLPFTGGENIAQYVAFAASVLDAGSSPDAIRQIGRKLGRFTVDTPAVRLVAAPLLGGGAGGLDSNDVVESLADGFKSSGHRDATLQISILDEPVFRGLVDHLERSSPRAGSDRLGEGAAADTRRPLRVFVSYSHTSSEHESWVESLGRFLRENGIDARLDIWHLRRGMDLSQFMANELTMADRVILVTDETYAAKADGRLGGVGWETMLIQGDMYRLPPESAKYLVIVVSPDADKGLPQYLRTKFVIHCPDVTRDVSSRHILLSELYDRVAPPPLGRAPVFV
jgi:TIR domain